MKIDLVNLNRQYKNIQNEISDTLEEVLESSRFILGDNVVRLENQIASYCNTSHGISCGNGTDALVMALDVLGIGSGDEVITSPFTFFASAEAISRVGAKPVFVDVDLKTYNMDYKLLEAKITKKTKAIIPVHIFGQPVEMDEIMEIANKYDLKIIEDACQAIGSEYKGKKIGSLGDLAVFSFFPTKNLGAYGDGGMIVTNNSVYAEKLKMLRFHGQKEKYKNEFIGYNSRLDEMQAAILNVKFKYLDKWNDSRRAIAHQYDIKLSNSNFILPLESRNGKHVYHLYVMQSEERERVISRLKSNDIGCGIYYSVPLHLQDAYLELGYKKGDFPNAEYLSERTFAVPMFPELTNDEVDFIVDTLLEV